MGRWILLHPVEASCDDACEALLDLTKRIPHLARKGLRPRRQDIRAPRRTFDRRRAVPWMPELILVPGARGMVRPIRRRRAGAPARRPATPGGIAISGEPGGQGALAGSRESTEDLQDRLNPRRHMLLTGHGPCGDASCRTHCSGSRALSANAGGGNPSPPSIRRVAARAGAGCRIGPHAPVVLPAHRANLVSSPHRPSPVPRWRTVSFSTALTLGVPRRWRDYIALCKPKVVALIVFTAIVGMLLAAPGMVPLDSLVFGTIGIGGAAAAGATVNHLADRRIDALMARTSGRPLPERKGRYCLCRILRRSADQRLDDDSGMGRQRVDGDTDLRLARGIRGDLQPLPQAGRHRRIS